MGIACHTRETVTSSEPLKQADPQRDVQKCDHPQVVERGAAGIQVMKVRPTVAFVSRPEDFLPSSA